MRGIEKRPPPLNVSPPGQLAMRFVDAEKDLLRRLEAFVPKVKEEEATERSLFARARFNAMHKKVIREALIAEQHGVCVYCEDRVREPEPESGVTAPPIEHWRPVSHSPNTAIHWKNLYQSCDRKECCDDRKDNTQLRGADGQHLPWPCEFAYEEALGVSKGGELYVRSDARLSEAQRAALTAALGQSKRDEAVGDPDACLNLNHPTLRAARLAAIDAERERLARAHRDRTVPAEEREVLAVAMLMQTTRPTFVSARVAWLRNQLGKGR